MKETLSKLSEPVAENVGNLTLPLSKTIGNTFSELWDFAIGSHVSFARERQIFRQSEKLERYKNNILNNIQSIPEERLIEAPLHVVGPAIDAAKFYVENEKLSEMFSNLIAAAFDTEMINKVHPSFTEVIKQMSPLDAQNLTEYKNSDMQPICDVVIRDLKTGGYIPLINNYYLGIDEEKYGAELHSTSIINLIRLGLVEFEKITLTDKTAYDKFYENDFYKVLTEGYSAVLDTGIFGEKSDFELIKKVVRLTSYGRDFVKTVLK